MRHALPRLLIATTLILAGCAQTGPGMVSPRAGAALDRDGFGNATMANHLAMTRRDGYVRNLAARFATEVDSTVTFAFNSAALDQDARDTLQRQAHWIRQFPEVRFRVYGHTDRVGSEAYNKALGLRRAHAVVAFLVASGVGRDRLEAVVSYGETQPLIVTEGRERRNRRTVTEVSGFVERAGHTLDGRYAAIIDRGYVASAAPATTLTGITGSTASPGE